MNNRTISLAVAAVAALAVISGCSGANADDAAPVDSTAAAPRTGSNAPRTTTTRVLAAGTNLDLRSVSRLSSAGNHAGDPIQATVASNVLSTSGAVVIPAGTVFSGTIQRISESTSPSSPGVLELNFTTLTIGSTSYPVDVAVTSMGSHLDNADVTTEDAAKVAASAAAGAIAGRIIGGDRNGARIGAGAGAVGGVIIANRTRHRDIVLLGGAAVQAVLSSPFSRTVTN